MKTLTIVYRWVVALTTMAVTGSIALILVLLSFGYLRNFCVKYIIRYSSRFILSIMGFKGIYPPIEAFPDYPVLYTFNHNSYLDIFLLTSMGLPNLRFLLSEKTIKYIPLVISAKATGTFFIPQKKHPKRRLAFFIRITDFLKRKRLSMAASSEGVHEHYHGIAPFNRGIYHMALEAKLPVVALFIYIPAESNPLYGKYAIGGTLRMEIMKEFPTDNWTLDNLDTHIDEVRKVFVKRFNELNPESPCE